MALPSGILDSPKDKTALSILVWLTLGVAVSTSYPRCFHGRITHFVRMYHGPLTSSTADVESTTSHLSEPHIRSLNHSLMDQSDDSLENITVDSLKYETPDPWVHFIANASMSQPTVGKMDTSFTEREKVGNTTTATVAANMNTTPNISDVPEEDKDRTEYKVTEDELLILYNTTGEQRVKRVRKDTNNGSAQELQHRIYKDVRELCGIHDISEGLCKISMIVNLTEDKISSVNLTKDRISSVNLTEEKIPIINLTKEKVPIINLTEDTMPIINLTKETMPIIHLTEETIPMVNLTKETIPILNLAKEITMGINLIKTIVSDSASREDKLQVPLKRTKRVTDIENFPVNATAREFLTADNTTATGGFPTKFGNETENINTTLDPSTVSNVTSNMAKSNMPMISEEHGASLDTQPISTSKPVNISTPAQSGVNATHESELDHNVSSTFPPESVQSNLSATQTQTKDAFSSLKPLELNQTTPDMNKVYNITETTEGPLGGVQVPDGMFPVGDTWVTSAEPQTITNAEEYEYQSEKKELDRLKKLDPSTRITGISDDASSDKTNRFVANGDFMKALVIPIFLVVLMGSLLFAMHNMSRYFVQRTNNRQSNQNNEGRPPLGEADAVQLNVITDSPPETSDLNATPRPEESEKLIEQVSQPNA